MRSLLLAAAASLALTTAAFAASTGEEIRSAISGNTVTGAMSASGPYAEYYGADGTITGADYSGTWTIEGDTMCFKYGDAAADCWNAQVDGTSIQWIKDGAVGGDGTIQPGNTVVPK